MAYNWDNYLIFAQNLDKNPALLNSVCDNETIQRCIVSRAYYAAFHAAKKKAESTEGVRFSRKGVHGIVQDWYFHHNKKDVFDDLRDLSKMRNQCDYDDHIQNLLHVLKNSLATADKIYKEI
ncbi:MAG: hypothetical protein WC342_08065 [Methanoregula sp.]|jgi:uncharacterized protein (UPF0332 family)